MSKKLVYRFEVDYGRGFEVQGLFVATAEEVAAVIDETAYFGEICGKFSDMDVDLEESQFTVVHSGAEIVSFVENDLMGGTGYNPLLYVQCPICFDPVMDCCCPGRREG